MSDEPQAAGTEDAATTAGAVDQASIDELLNQAQSALSSIDEPPAPLPPGVKPFEFKDLLGASPRTSKPASTCCATCSSI